MGATRRNLLRCSETPAGEGHLGSHRCHGNRKTGSTHTNGFFKENDVVTVLRAVEREQSTRTVMFRVDTFILWDLAFKPFSVSEEPSPPPHPPVTCYLMESRAHIF